MATESKQRCQRIGCDAKFTPDDNPEDSCRYHPGPKFHDGGKEWSCCKQRSHDFSLFLDLPGCKTGKHTSEKPQQTKPASSVQNKPILLNTGNTVAASNCNRCRQGFFCSDHGSKLAAKVPATAPNVTTVPVVVEKKAAVSAPREILDLNAKQTCKNIGCGKEFIEKENTDTACSFHPGPAVFHDRSRGWKCCDIHVKEFDEFLEIPPCTKGWHNANPEKS